MEWIFIAVLVIWVLHHARRLDIVENAIRKHRDQRGDDRCWMDDEDLYKILPEGYVPPERDTSVELHLCKQYIENRHNPNTTYISPQREIERLTEQLNATNCEKTKAT